MVTTIVYLPLAFVRSGVSDIGFIHVPGGIGAMGERGYWWSRTVNGTYAHDLVLRDEVFPNDYRHRWPGFPLRYLYHQLTHHFNTVTKLSQQSNKPLVITVSVRYN